jgi:hypothetical protein
MVGFGLAGLAGTPPMVLVVGCGSTGGGTVGSVVGKLLFCTDVGASSGEATGGGGSVVVVDGATAVPGVTTEDPGGNVDSWLGEPTGGGVIEGMVLVLVGPDGGIGSADDGAATPGCVFVGAIVDGPTVDGDGTAGCGVTAIDCAEATPACAATARPMPITMALMILMFPLRSYP